MSEDLKPMEFLCWQKTGKKEVGFVRSWSVEVETVSIWELKATEASRFRVGRVYEIPARINEAGNLTAHISAAKFVRILEDAELLAKLEANEDVRRVKEINIKKETESRRYEELAERLMPYRELYSESWGDPAKQRMIELIVLDALHKRTKARK